MKTAQEQISILVIDASSEHLPEVCKTLESKGYWHLAQKDLNVPRFQNINFDCILLCSGKEIALQRDTVANILHANPEIPLIVLTSNVTADSTIEALQTGVFDLVIMPALPDHLIRSVDRAIRNRRQRMRHKNYSSEVDEKLRQSIASIGKGFDIESLYRFAALAEFRDSIARSHGIRVGQYCYIMARALSLPSDFAKSLRTAAPLHDIGKLCMPDSVLLKEGALTRIEIDLMQKHTLYGRQLLESCCNPGLEMAANIALTHHERWDGTGYPGRLKRNDIPIEGRIVNICDQYDTLRSARAYKRPISHEEASNIILKGDGRTSPKHFDPDILALFKEQAVALNAIFELSMLAESEFDSRLYSRSN
jgi:putative two-component system response regulator